MASCTFEFRAFLIGSSRSPDDTLLAWYRDMALDFGDELPGLIVESLGHGRFRGTFTGGAGAANPRIDIEMFVDPDEDGNHPVKVGLTTYLVRGELVSINGVAVATE
jgi:hypothetical protein